MRITLRITSCIVALALSSACGGGGGGATGGPGTGSLTVSGRVLSFFNTPLANVAVVVDEQGPIVTDPNGAFQVSGVRVPYDAIVIDGPGGGAVVWQGLTRADPTFVYTVAGGGIPPVSASASVQGTVSGGVGFPIPAPPPDVETDVNLWVTAGDLFGSGSATPNTVTGAYTEPNLNWVGPAPFELTISALQYTLDGAGMPLLFTGFGQLVTPITNGAALAGQNVAMGPVGNTTAAGTTVWPPSVTTFIRAMFLTLPGGGFMALPTDASGTPNFVLRAPATAGLERALITYGLTLSGEVVYHVAPDLPAPASSLDIQLPNIAGPVLPVDGVTGVDYATEFTLAPPLDPVVYFVDFEPNGGGPGPEIRVVTKETVVTIPDLTAYGLGIPPSAHYDWDVASRGPATTVDDVAVEGEFVPGLFATVGPGVQYGSGSVSRSFFFAP